MNYRNIAKLVEKKALFNKALFIFCVAITAIFLFSSCSHGSLAFSKRKYTKGNFFNRIAKARSPIPAKSIAMEKLKASVSKSLIEPKPEMVKVLTEPNTVLMALQKQGVTEEDIFKPMLGTKLFPDTTKVKAFDTTTTNEDPVKWKKKMKKYGIGAICLGVLTLIATIILSSSSASPSVPLLLFLYFLSTILVIVGVIHLLKPYSPPIPSSPRDNSSVPGHQTTQNAPVKYTSNYGLTGFLLTLLSILGGLIGSFVLLATGFNAMGGGISSNAYNNAETDGGILLIASGILFFTGLIFNILGLHRGDKHQGFAIVGFALDMILLIAILFALL